jgi:hypothetical protein
LPKDVKKRKSGGKKSVEKLQDIRKIWFGGRCMWIYDNGKQCEQTFDLELAHAVDTDLSKAQTNSRSSWHRLKDTLEHPECFLLFCSKHHREFDGRDTNLWQEEYYGDK